MDDHRAVGEVAHPVNSLASLQLSEETLDSVTGHIGRLAVEALPGWHGAATSVVERTKLATFGATQPELNKVDQCQYDQNAGPCVDALGGEVHYFDGDSVKPEWRQFTEVAADSNVYSVVSFPLKIQDEVIGALNLYSRERDALRQGQREEGLLFAAQASVTLSNLRELRNRKTQLDQLREGLETRTVIGQATGLLMAQEGLSSEEAFHKLVHVSQNANIKLREIAKRYVESWENKAQETP